MSRPLRNDSLGGRHHGVAVAVADERAKPNLRGFKVYVGDFVGVDDPGNDPPDTSPTSPPFLNGFGYQAGQPLWFAHGLDGETDMGGAYDLVTGGPVSGDVAFVMPGEWRSGMPDAAAFPVELATDVWTIAVQTHDPATGNVRVFWPIVATAYP